MKQIGEILEDIRDMPVCPKSGEVNLYYIIQKHIEDGIFQSNSKGATFLNGSEQGRVWNFKF